MCIIIAIDTGKPLPSTKELEFCWEQNPDNGGLMFVNEDDKLVIEKYDDRDKYIAALASTHKKYGSTTPIVAHMRYATLGNVNLKNTHPFFVSENVAIAHNGSFHEFTNNGKDESDTIQFVNTVLKDLPEQWYIGDEFRLLMEYYLNRSRLVVLDSDRNLRIFNTDLGEMKEGIWYSNDYFKVARVTYGQYGYSSYCDSKWYDAWNEYSDKNYEQYSEPTQGFGNGTHGKGTYRYESRMDKLTNESYVHAKCNCCHEQKKTALFYVFLFDQNIFSSYRLCPKCAEKLCRNNAHVIYTAPTICDCCDTPFNDDSVFHRLLSVGLVGEAPARYYGFVCKSCVSSLEKPGVTRLKDLVENRVSGDTRLLFDGGILRKDAGEVFTHFMEWYREDRRKRSNYQNSHFDMHHVYVFEDSFTQYLKDGTNA